MAGHPDSHLAYGKAGPKRRRSHPSPGSVLSPRVRRDKSPTDATPATAAHLDVAVTQCSRRMHRIQWSDPSLGERAVLVRLLFGPAMRQLSRTQPTRRPNSRSHANHIESAVMSPRPTVRCWSVLTSKDVEHEERVGGSAWHGKKGAAGTGQPAQAMSWPAKNLHFVCLLNKLFFISIIIHHQ